MDVKEDQVHAAGVAEMCRRQTDARGRSGDEGSGSFSENRMEVLGHLVAFSSQKK